MRQFCFCCYWGDIFWGGGWGGGGAVVGGWWQKAVQLLVPESLCQKVSVFVVFALTVT